MADQSILSSRAVLGMYYEQLDAATLPTWIDGVSNLFTSDQASETYPFLGFTPTMREWLGGRQAKALAANQVTIINKHFEATLPVAIKDLRRDKTGQLETRISEFIGEGQRHWEDLLSDFIIAAPSTTCYDGQFFFDTDHSEGSSGTQDNDLSVDISALSAAVHGVVTDPSIEEMQQCILKAIAAIISFKDDRARPRNTSARKFMVMVGTPLLWNKAIAATSTMLNSAIALNLNPNGLQGMSVTVELNPRLSTWTDSFAVFRTDSPIKSLIRQSELEPNIEVLGEGSDHAFKHKEILIGVDAWRNCGYGAWQNACYVTMI